MSAAEKKYKKDEGTVIAYHRYVQGIISERLNSIALGPGRTPFLIAQVLFPLSLVFLTVGLFLILLRPHHLYLVGVWPKFLGPFFVILFILLFGASVFFFDLASKKSNKFRRKLKFRGHGLYGTKVIHESHVEREKLIKEEYKSGTAPHKPKTQRSRYDYRRGAQNEGYDPPGERGAGRPRHRDARPRDERPRRVEAPERVVYGGEQSGQRSRDERNGFGRHERRDYPEVDSRGPLREREMTRDDRGGRDERFSERLIAGEDESTDGAAISGRRGRYAPQGGQQQRRYEPRHSGSRYDGPPPDRFYDDRGSAAVEPAESHHVVGRRTAQPAERYSERNVDEELPPAIPRVPAGAQRYQLQFNTDAQDSAV